MTRPKFKLSTFLRKRDALRDAIRREGTPAVQTAWDAFEGMTDCLPMKREDPTPLKPDQKRPRIRANQGHAQRHTSRHAFTGAATQQKTD